MRNWHLRLRIFSLLVVVVVIFITGAAAQAEGTLTGWPRSYEDGGNKVIVHQPQLDDWKDYTELNGKAAVAVELKGEGKEYYGAVTLQAVTETDFDTRIVLLKDIKVTDVTFPNLEDQLAERCRRAVMSALPAGRQSMTISLDRILAGLERTAQQVKAVAVNLDPPPIYYSESSAVLVMFMGDPKFEPVPGISALLYAVNTNWDIILEVGTSNYYMLNARTWLVTKDLVKGPWQPARTLPRSFLNLPDDDNWKAVKENIPGYKASMVPRVLVTTEPAELIQTSGPPSYSPIAGTSLLYVTNTESDIFLHSVSGQIYFLTAGRWFKAKELSGPWTAASAELPKDFAKIPADHSKADVLSSVPGTPEAEAAVLLASVPRKATVDRNNTTVEVVYEGDPEFVEISGTTSKVYYAVNSPFSIFRVDSQYYTVHNGIWFVSVNASGPWLVCTVVPPAIYSIPATHPKHNVTYVYIYDSTPDTVVVGYTTGYSGTYVATTGVIVFGLGYWIVYDDHYSHYHHYHYHSHYYSYGTAAHYNYYHGGYYHSARYYGPHGGAGGWAGYDPSSGTYYRGGYASGPYGSAFAREAYNPYTNRYAAQAGSKTPYGSWGRTVVADGNEWARAGHRSRQGKTVAGVETSKGAKAVGGYNRWTDQGALVGKDKYGDVYVGRDGNVYKRNGDTWQQRSSDGWNNVDTSAAKSAAQSRTEAARSKASNSQVKRPVPGTPRASGSYGGYSPQAPSWQGSSNNLNREYQKRSTGNSRATTYQKRSSGGSGPSRRRR